MHSEDSFSRRDVLASSVTAGLVAIAGCSGDGDGAGTESGTTVTQSPTSTPDPTSTRTGMTTEAETTESDDASLPTPAIGPSDAEVTVSVFEDYLCGHCAHYNLNGFPNIKSEYVDPGSIRYEHYDFPVVHETWSWRSAIAARSVQATVGGDAFWPYAKQLFAKRQETGIELYRSIAREVGADPDVVEQDVLEEQWRPVVEADQQRGRDQGVTGSPTFFINGTEVDPKGHDSWYSAVSAAIDDALE
jgi:protein-disulfide isomerase